MKYGAQITTTKDGAWSVSQLIQRVPNGEFIRDKDAGGVIFVDHSKPDAKDNLFAAVQTALSGQIKRTSGV